MDCVVSGMVALISVVVSRVVLRKCLDLIVLILRVRVIEGINTLVVFPVSIPRLRGSIEPLILLCHTTRVLLVEGWGMSAQLFRLVLQSQVWRLNILLIVDESLIVWFRLFSDHVWNLDVCDNILFVTIYHLRCIWLVAIPWVIRVFNGSSAWVWHSLSIFFDLIIPLLSGIWLKLEWYLALILVLLGICAILKVTVKPVLVFGLLRVIFINVVRRWQVGIPTIKFILILLHELSVFGIGLMVVLFILVLHLRVLNYVEVFVGRHTFIDDSLVGLIWEGELVKVPN